MRFRLERPSAARFTQSQEYITYVNHTRADDRVGRWSINRVSNYSRSVSNYPHSNNQRRCPGQRQVHLDARCNLTAELRPSKMLKQSIKSTVKHNKLPPSWPGHLAKLNFLVLRIKNCVYTITPYCR